MPSPALSQSLDLTGSEMHLRITSPRGVVVIQEFPVPRRQSGCDQPIPRILVIKPGRELVPSAHKQRLTGRGIGGKLPLVPNAASKERPFARVLFALGIEEVGEVTGRNLAQSFGDVEALLEASPEAIAEVPGIGEKMAASIAEQLRDERMRKLIDDLRTQGLCFREEGPPPSEGRRPSPGCGAPCGG